MEKPNGCDRRHGNGPIRSYPDGATFWASGFSRNGSPDEDRAALRHWSRRKKRKSIGELADSQAFELFLDVSTMLGAAVRGTQENLVLKGTPPLVFTEPSV